MAWKPGQSGNRKGAPTEKEFVAALRLAVNEPDETTGKKKLRVIAEKLVAEAINGESWAIQQVADRLDGKPAQESTNYNYSEVGQLSDDELRRLLSERLLNGGVDAGVPKAANGTGKPH